MKIYTRTGDDGTTGLFSGERVPKAHARVEVYGTIDELNSVLGVARSGVLFSKVGVHLEAVQRQLFKLGADLASPGESVKIERIGAVEVAWLEATIDEMTAEIPPLRYFILPGGTSVAAQIHVARAICRRAEREAVRLDVGGAEVLAYLNRLSDFLFTLARFENALAGVNETEWHP